MLVAESYYNKKDPTTFLATFSPACRLLLNINRLYNSKLTLKIEYKIIKGFYKQA